MRPTNDASRWSASRIGARVETKRGKNQHDEQDLGKTELKTQKQENKKTKPSHEKEKQNGDVGSSCGPPFGRHRGAKSNQKGVLEAGRFAPTSRLILG